MKGRNLLKKNEFYITVIIIVLACIIQVISGQFFTSNNLVDLLRSTGDDGSRSVYGHRIRKHRCFFPLYSNALYVCGNKMVFCY